MSILSSIIGKILEIIYNVVSSIGTEPTHVSYFALSLIILTLIYKLATLPVTLSNIKMQKMNAIMQPEMKKLEKKYKHDPQLYQQKVMELQKEMGFSPFASCLPMVIQLVIVYALFAVMRDPMKYLGIKENIATNFFWIPSLLDTDPTIVLPILLAGTQFLFSFVATPKTNKDANAPNDPMQSMNFTMKYVMPIMFFFFARNYKAGLALYWTVGNIIEVIIRLILNNSKREELLAEEAIEKKKDKFEKKDTKK